MLTSPSGKIYIGQTIHQVEKRLKKHQQKSSGCRAIYNAIQYHGWENFEKYWYECPDDDLNKHEELMIEVLGTLSPDGYNLKEGGANGKASEESKQKNKEAKLGEKNPNFGLPKSKETKQKMSEAHRGEKSYMFGIPKSTEHKQRVSEATKGEKNHNFGKTGEKHPNSIKVYRYALDGTFIDSFESGREAGRYLNNDGSKISACARGERKTAHKYKWSYVKH